VGGIEAPVCSATRYFFEPPQPLSPAGCCFCCRFSAPAPDLDPLKSCCLCIRQHSGSSARSEVTAIPAGSSSDHWYPLLHLLTVTGKLHIAKGYHACSGRQGIDTPGMCIGLNGSYGKPFMVSPAATSASPTASSSQKGVRRVRLWASASFCMSFSFPVRRRLLRPITTLAFR
jgi:hypothetical protein